SLFAREFVEDLRARRIAHSFAELRVLEELANALRHTLLVGRRNNESHHAVVDLFANARNLGCHHRKACVHCVENGARKTFRTSHQHHFVTYAEVFAHYRWHDGDIGRSVNCMRLRLPTGEHDIVETKRDLLCDEPLLIATEFRNEVAGAYEK